MSATRAHSGQQQRGRKKGGAVTSLIADNRKARHLYTLEQCYQAGVVLQGWEVKSLRAGRAQLADSYVVIRAGELYLLNAQISPLPTVSTHFTPVADRTRKLLMNRGEINKLIGAVERRGYALVPLKLFWQHGLAKLELALAKGKKLYDKRQAEREHQWQLQKLRLKKISGLHS